VRFGRLGSGGQTRERTFPDPELAGRELELLIAEKLRKGYQPAVDA
jgi:predicted DNA-binding WGR domain protein